MHICMVDSCRLKRIEVLTISVFATLLDGVGGGEGELLCVACLFILFVFNMLHKRKRLLVQALCKLCCKLQWGLLFQSRNGPIHAFVSFAS